MSKKQFVQSHGATCSNWTWAWSYVNEAERFVIFAAWEDMTDGLEATILEESWRETYLGRVAHGYEPAVRHLELVENEDYDLFIFRARKAPELTKSGAVKMREFERKLIPAQVHREADAWIAKFMAPPWEHQDVSPSHNVSARRLQECLKEFQRYILEEDGVPFESFSTGTPGEQEGYKTALVSYARTLLSVDDWRADGIGTGEVLKRVIKAIEIKELPDGDTTGNNLVSWRRFGLPGSLDSFLEDPEKLHVLEQILYDFYTNRLSASEAFEALTDVIGRLYPLTAYLFFIKDPECYLPIAPRTFDEFFDSIGVALKTDRQCHWENYQSYLQVIAQVRDFLREEGYENTSLLDAHSFCWMAARLNLEIEVKKLVPVLKTPVPTDEPGPESKSSREPDWLALHRARMLLGQRGEEIALDAEMNRLTKAGQPELAEKVNLVSADHTYGFDIYSFETDGTERLIEVKATRETGNEANFSTSWRQWKMALSDANYYYYIVSIPKDGEPTVTMLKASKIPENSATPVVYNVAFRME